MPGRAIEEEVYALLDEVAGAAAGALRGRQTGSIGAGSSEIAEEVRALLSARFDEEWPLSRLASRFGLSTFRLCRAFRKATGSTIHRYLLTLRLRSSLERFERPGVEITSVALDLGFSSHSHFALTFGRNFRETPSACRLTLAGPHL
jgi:AraC-like DNA-binding protein